MAIWWSKNSHQHVNGTAPKIELIPQDDSESYQKDAKKLAQSLMKVRNITDVKNLLSAMSLSAAIKQELVVQIETSVLDIILGKNYAVDVKSHNKTYTLSNRDLAKHLIYKSSYKKLTSNQTNELYKREALYRAENKVIVALAKNKHRVALAFDRVKKLPDYHRTSASFNNRAGIAGV